LFDFLSVILFFILTSQNHFSQHEDVKLSHTLIEIYLRVTAVLLLTLIESKRLAITVNSELKYWFFLSALKPSKPYSFFVGL